MADSAWENLVAHLLDLILSKLESRVDYVHFSLVCELWRSNAIDSFDKQKLNNHPAPLLLLPTKIEEEEGGEWSLYNFSGEKFLGSKLQLPEYSTQFCASSEGWSATIDEDMAVTLHNPFVPEKDSVIHLPPLPIWKIQKIPSRAIHKILTFTPNPSDDPTDLTCVLLFRDMFYSSIVYIQPRKDTKWNTANFATEWKFDDVVYYKNRLYALTSELDQFFAFDYIQDRSYSFYSGDVCLKYLVKSLDGELLQVQKIRSPTPTTWTLSFKVFKCCFETSSWTKMDSLGDSALFLGDNTSVWATASRFSKCKRNHIYFTRGEESYIFKDAFDFGEYNLETGSITSFGNIVPKVMGSKMPIPTPVWVLPTVRF